jgi:hypothetical protein
MHEVRSRECAREEKQEPTALRPSPS